MSTTFLITIVLIAVPFFIGYLVGFAFGRSQRRRIERIDVWREP